MSRRPGVYAGSGTSGSDTDAGRRAGSGTSESDTDAGRRADRFHGLFDMGSEDAGDGSPVVDVALEEPSSETAATELAGMMMRFACAGHAGKSAAGAPPV